jgi:hypothetical protein
VYLLRLYFLAVADSLNAGVRPQVPPLVTDSAPADAQPEEFPLR